MARMSLNVWRVERPISSVSSADAKGTVASSSKINEPFRRAVGCRTGALREWRIPLLMTDGRAITGMTADSHARSDIPTFFSPGISIFSDRIEPDFRESPPHRVGPAFRRKIRGHL